MIRTTQDQRERKVAVCRTCRLEKPWSEFDKSKDRRPFGLSSNCSSCERIRKAEQKRRKRKENPEGSKIYDRRSNLRRKFGITPEEYEAMSEAQNHACAICHKPETDFHTKAGKVQRLAVDHNHETREVRGLLCARCNKGLGLLQDDPDLLVKAAQYLRQALLSSQGQSRNIPLLHKQEACEDCEQTFQLPPHQDQ